MRPSVTFDEPLIWTLAVVTWPSVISPEAEPSIEIGASRSPPLAVPTKFEMSSGVPGAMVSVMRISAAWEPSWMTTSSLFMATTAMPFSSA